MFMLNTCVYESSHVLGCTCMHVCVWRPKFDIRNLPCSLATLRSGNLVSFSCMCISNFDRSIYWRDCPFSNICSWSLGQWLAVLYYAVLITVALSHVLKSCIMMSSTSFFLHNTALGILNLVYLHMNFVIVFSSSEENNIGILMDWVCELLWVEQTFWQRYCMLPISEQFSFCFI